MGDRRIQLRERVPVILDEAAVLPFLAPSGGAIHRRRRHRQRKSRAGWVGGFMLLVAIGAVAWTHASARAGQIEHALTWQLGPRFFTDFDLQPYLEDEAGAPAAATAWTVGAGSAAYARTAVRPAHLALDEPATGADTPAMVATAAAPQGAATQPRSPGAVVARHEPRFTALEQVAMHKLDTLYETGREEYAQQSRMGVLDQMVLVLKYLEAGRLLERNMDAVFQAMVSDLRQDLAANELPVDAVALVETEYVSRKERLRGHYLSRIRQRDR
jgi:hypothetical protein